MCGACLNRIATSVFASGQALAGAKKKRHAAPSPVVHEEFQSHECVRGGIGLHAFFLAVSRHCSPFTTPGPYCPRTTDFQIVSCVNGRMDCSTLIFSLRTELAPNVAGASIGDERCQLQHVALNHVPQRACRFVERRAVLDSQRFRRRYLHVVDVIAIPKRLENSVAEPKYQQVLDGLLSEVMVNPVDLRLIEYAQNLLVQIARRRAVMAKRLFDDHARPRTFPFGLRQTRAAQAARSHADKHPEESPDKRDGCRQAVLAVEFVKPLRQPSEGFRIVVISAEILHLLHEFLAFVSCFRPTFTFARASSAVTPEIVIAHLRARKSEEPEPRRQTRVPRQIEQRRQQLSARQISRRAEHHNGTWVRRSFAKIGACAGGHLSGAARDVDRAVYSWPESLLEV